MVVNEQLEMVEERDGEPVIFCFIQNCISEGFFLLYTQLRHSISFSLLQEKKKKERKEREREREKESMYLYYIMFSK